MSQLRPLFEKELKTRVGQKTKPNQPEDVTLIKSFKYFDLANTGYVNREEFYKTIQKVGVNTFDKEEVFALFEVYDLDKTGKVDYKEFASIVYGNSTVYTRQNSPSKDNQKKVSNDNQDLFEAVETLKDKVYDRGLNGLLGLANVLKQSDKNRDRKFQLNQLDRVFHECNLDISQRLTEKIFTWFDSDGDGIINYEDMLQEIKGKLSSYRRSLIEQAFYKLDKNQDGFVDLKDLKATYDAQHHPDVIIGRRQVKEVVAEFEESLEWYTFYKGIRSKALSLQEFEDYYGFISFAVTDDQYYGALLNNLWRLNEPEPNPKTQTRRIETSDPVREIVNDKDNFQRHIEGVFKRFKTRVCMKGPRGALLLKKNFRNADYDADDVISHKEFLKVVKDFKADLTEQDSKLVFAYFDRDGTSTINYSDFLSAVVGRLDDFRSNICQAAWRKLTFQSGTNNVNIDDLVASFGHLRSHPDVKSGKKSEEQISDEYTDMIYMNHSFGPNPKLSIVNQEEFESFITYLSAPVEDEKYFELIMINTFKLQSDYQVTDSYAGSAVGRKDYNPRAGYLQDFHRSIVSGGSVSQNAPFGTMDQKQQEVRRPTTAFSIGDDRPSTRSSYRGEDSRKSSNNNQSDELITLFRQKIFSRSIRGYFQFYKNLHLADDNGSGLVSFKDFSRIAGDMRFDFTDKQLQLLVTATNTAEGNDVQYHEFLRAITGELSDYRRKTVANFFEKLDRDFKGYLVTDQLYNIFNAKNHPDTKFGKKSEDEVLMEFLDTYEIHHNISKNDPRTKDNTVTLEEFSEYYRVLSCTIPDDTFFEFLMGNTWSSIGKGQIKGYYNPYYDKNNAASFKRSFF